MIEGTRLLKPGLDAIYATVLDMTWDDSNSSNRPNISATFVKCSDYLPDEDLAKECLQAYDVLAPLRNTELARVPVEFEPLSSFGSREKVTTMGKYICSLLRSALNVSRRQRAMLVDAVLIMGGNIRGGTDYPLKSFFFIRSLRERNQTR